MSTRILILGGYGNFGARLAHALARLPGTIVIIAGRDPAKAAALAAELGAPTEAVAFDHQQEAGLAALADARPDLVIHTAGPFQGQQYQVARTALAAGAHYIDLADGRDFVVGFADALHGEAVAAGRLAVSGASTLPGLSSAVVDALAPAFHRLDEIQIAIAPAQRAPRGLATFAAVLSYCGQRFDWLENGRQSQVYGWQSLRQVSVPGVGRRWAAACDVPDLALFPRRYRGLRTVQFRAALEFGVQHAALWLLSAIGRLGIRPDWSRFAPTFFRLTDWMNGFGGERGGMVVELRGRDATDRPLTARWNLMAPDNNGPEVPTLATVALAQKLIAHHPLPMGAQPCMGLLTLDDFAPLFEQWGIETDISWEGAAPRLVLA